MFTAITDISAIDVVDIAAASILFYLVFLWFKKTKSSFVFAGIVICGMVYMIVKILRLKLVTTLMNGFFAVILVAVIIIFQEEIRRLFEQIARWSLSPKFRKSKISYDSQRQVKILVNTLSSLSEEKIGALIVLTGGDIVGRHIDGGVELDGILSESLLKSIFDTHSDGHDGGVLIEKGRISCFACHLPLSQDFDQLKEKGTRHAAALGLSELTDVLSIVVSESTGAVSVARHGTIRQITDRKNFEEILYNFQKESTSAHQRRNLKSLFLSNLRIKMTAVLLSILLWFVLIHESVTIYKTFYIPVQYVGLADNLVVKDIEPEMVKVVLSAARRDFYFMDNQDIRIASKLFSLDDLQNSDEGRYETTITASDLSLPSGYTVVNIFPRNIRFHIEEKTE